MRFVDNTVSRTFAIATYTFYLRLWSSGWRGSMGSPHLPEREKEPSVRLKDMAVEHLVFWFSIWVYPHVGSHPMI